MGPNKRTPFIQELEVVDIPEALLNHVVQDLEESAIAHGPLLSTNDVEQREFIVCVLRRLIVSRFGGKIRLVPSDRSFLSEKCTWIYVARNGDPQSAVPQLLGQLYSSCRNGEIMYGAVSSACIWIFAGLEKSQDGEVSAFISKTLMFEFTPHQPWDESDLNTLRSILRHLVAVLTTMLSRLT
eukprot:tig00001003_g6295.t1